MKSHTSHYVKYALVMFAVCSLFIPIAAHGYSENFSYGVDAKWSNNLNFMICLANSEGKEYENLFLKAVEEWKSRWNHFGYTLSRGSGCHINIFIIQTHPMFDKPGEIGYTNIAYFNHGAITKADITLPTYQKSTYTTEVKGKKVKEEILEPLSKVQFYRAALHEFGHALNLGHFDDNGYEPIDIMYAYPAPDDQEQGISQRDIEALNWLYLGFFENEMTVKADKKYYQAGDTVSVSGKVSGITSKQAVKLEILDPSKKVHMSDNVQVSTSGSFTYKWKIPTDIVQGLYRVKVSYTNMIADAWFDVNNPNKTTELSFATEASKTNPSATKDKVTVVETLFVDNSGSKTTSIRAQEQVFLRSSLSSSLKVQTEATYIIQIKDAKGYTVEISSGTYTLVNGLSTFSQSWLPVEPGKYGIQIFFWKSISNPEPLIPTPIELEAVAA